MAKAKKSKAKKPGKKKAKKAIKRAAAKSRKRPAKAKKPAPRKAKKAAPRKKQIVGEGDYAASRAFDKDQANFVKRNKDKIPQMGKQAEQALEGPEGASLKAAEQEAMNRSTIDHRPKAKCRDPDCRRSRHFYFNFLQRDCFLAPPLKLQRASTSEYGKGAAGPNCKRSRRFYFKRDCFFSVGSNSSAQPLVQ